MKNIKEIKKDVMNLKPKQLNEKYPKEYNSWRAMKQRSKTHDAIIHEDFVQFSSFLQIMGTKPSDEHTLDRIDFDDPEYSPKKVRWATKKQQSNNKSDNVLITSVEGITHTLAEWAFKTNQNPDTLRQRRARGWNDTEIITGIRDSGVALKSHPFPYYDRKNWENSWLDYALDGGPLPRIEFLLEELEKEVTKLKLKKHFIKLISDSKDNPELEIQEHIENASRGTQKGLSDYCAHLSTLNDEKYRSEKMEVEEYLKQKEPILNQVREQVEYDRTYENALENKPDTLTKGQFRDYYAKRKPRPKYTVNLPTFDSAQDNF